MRVVAGGSSTHPALNALSRPMGAEAERKFVQFKAALRAKLEKQGPADANEAWQQFRRVAVSLFGDAALAPQRDGESFRRLRLRPAHLRQLADHPGKIRQHIEKLQAQGRFPKDTARWSAAEAATLFSRTARAFAPRQDRDRASFTVATINDDFTDRFTNVPDVKASVVLVQEAKNTNLRREMRKKDFGVHQDFSRKDRAGAAVVWDKDKVKADDRGYALGVHPNGHKMLTRWISWTDVKIDGVKVRVASVHRPPPRDSELWPRFNANLGRFVRNTKGPVIIGLDANHRNPVLLEKATGLKWHAPKGSIDGFLVSPGIDVENIRRLPKRRSDHHPVIARFTVREK